MVLKIQKNATPILKNDEKMYVYLKGSHFQQNYVLTTSNDHVINDNVIYIYIVYKLDPIATTRDTTTFTIQNSLFGAMQITTYFFYYLKRNKKIQNISKHTILIHTIIISFATFFNTG